MGIDRTGRMPSFHGYRFRLMFPPGVDVATVTVAYGNLSYIQSVEHPFDIEDARTPVARKGGRWDCFGCRFYSHSRWCYSKRSIGQWEVLF